MKYFILLETTAVLSLESKYENIVVSSQSSATICLIITKIIKAVNKEHWEDIGNDMLICSVIVTEMMERWLQLILALVWVKWSLKGHLVRQWNPDIVSQSSESEGWYGELHWPAPSGNPPHQHSQWVDPVYDRNLLRICYYRHMHSQKSLHCLCARFENN